MQAVRKNTSHFVPNYTIIERLYTSTSKIALEKKKKLSINNN